MEKGHWEVKGDDGIWHVITGIQAAAYRLDGAEVRFVGDK